MLSLQWTEWYWERFFTGTLLLLGRGANSSPPSSAEVKNRVELYLYSP
jgi:hypothetical protein